MNNFNIHETLSPLYAISHCKKKSSFVRIILRNSARQSLMANVRDCHYRTQKQRPSNRLNFLAGSANRRAAIKRGYSRSHSSSDRKHREMYPQRYLLFSQLAFSLRNYGSRGGGRNVCAFEEQRCHRGFSWTINF